MGRGPYEGSAVIKAMASFWTWSTSAYEQQGVAECLLRLQDKLNLNVNVVLWCVWCAMRCNDLPEAGIRRALTSIEAIDAQVTRPLRGIRRKLRDLEAESDVLAVQALRQLVKSAELQSEAIQQATLEKLAPPSDSVVSDRDALIGRARRNLAIYARIAGAANLPGFSVSLLEAAIKAIHPQAADARN